MPKTVQDEADTVNNVGEQSEPKAQTFKSDKSDKHKAEPTGSVSANPKFDTRQKQLKNENNKVPISLPREYFADGLNYDSLVEFKENNDTIRGVIRWMGHTGDPQKIIAGVEVGNGMPDNMKPGLNSGKLRGVRLFDCETGKGYFISLNRCKPDARFHIIRQADMKPPTPVDPKAFDCEFGIGSVVQVLYEGKGIYGMVKWMGYILDKSKIIVGIESECELTKGNNGNLKGHQLFVCPPNKGLFTSLKACLPDDRAQITKYTADDTTKDWNRIRLLGVGSFGEVFLCQNKDGKQFACKQIKCSIEEILLSDNKLKTEVETLKKFKHPRIVEYIGIEHSPKDSCICIFLEYMKGGSIRSKLAKEGTFPENEVRHYTKQILEGLTFLHEHGVIHRDIKGSNVLLDDLTNIKLADFGTAVHVRIIHGKTATTKAKQTGIGTPNWMAPEVIQGEKYGRKVDIWSLGCTIVEMFTKHPPWSELDAFAAMFKIGSGVKPEYTLPQGVNPDTEQFLSCCFCKDPDKRSSAQELLEHAFCQIKE